jgi:hypothetical protein
LVRDDGTTFAVLASHAAEPLTVEPALEDRSALAPPGSQETVAEITLEPFGIKVFTIIRDH